MPARSAGILLFRLDGGEVQVLIAHMGGPFWAAKDEGAWTIPKGEYEASTETALDAARREFREELGVDPPDAPVAELGTFAYSSGKRITVFVADGTGFAAPTDGFGTFELEWPPRSGRRREFPEVDRAEWMPVPAAETRLVKGQVPVMAALRTWLG